MENNLLFAPSPPPLYPHPPTSATLLVCCRAFVPGLIRKCGTAKIFTWLTHYFTSSHFLHHVLTSQHVTARENNEHITHNTLLTSFTDGHTQISHPVARANARLYSLRLCSTSNLILKTTLRFSTAASLKVHSHWGDKLKLEACQQQGQDWCSTVAQAQDKHIIGSRAAVNSEGFISIWIFISNLNVLKAAFLLDSIWQSQGEVRICIYAKAFQKLIYFFGWSRKCCWMIPSNTYILYEKELSWTKKKKERKKKKGLPFCPGTTRTTYSLTSKWCSSYVWVNLRHLVSTPSLFFGNS